jgi:hypothetical protein
VPRDATQTTAGNGPNSAADQIYGRAWNGSRVLRVTGTFAETVKPLGFKDLCRTVSRLKPKEQMQWVLR